MLEGKKQKHGETKSVTAPPNPPNTSLPQLEKLLIG
jgi:hypothetical protein